MRWTEVMKGKLQPVILAAALAASALAIYTFSGTAALPVSSKTVGHELAASGDPGPLWITDLSAVALDYTYLQRTYRSRGYAVCPAAVHRGFLHLHRPVDCQQLFQMVLADQSRQLRETPPQHLAPFYRQEYLLDGNVELLAWYFNDKYNGHPQPLHWSQAYMEQMMAAAARKENLAYEEWNQAVYHALESVDLSGQKGLVVGSEKPWVEAAILNRGIAHVTTSEYRQITTEHPQHAAYHPREQAELFLKGDLQPYDFAFTYSSIEHSGLGRYGDPLDPNGDLKETAKLSCLVKPGGLLFLGVPLNADAIVYNAHRLYGPVRLPLVAANWVLRDVFDKDQPQPITDLSTYFFKEAPDFATAQPVIVLTNNRQTPCT